MHINIQYDWDNSDYNCTAYPEKKELVSIKIETLDSDIAIYKIGEKNLYLIELWGGSGPSMNSFDITDNKTTALECFKKYLDLCVDMLIDEEIDKEKIFAKAKEILEI